MNERRTDRRVPSDTAPPQAEDEAMIEIPIDGVLDLHTFQPGEVKELVPDYITACIERGIFELRIIHGKGRGVLRAHVRSILARDPRVAEIRNADERAGSFGATLVTLLSAEHQGDD